MSGTKEGRRKAQITIAQRYSPEVRHQWGQRSGRAAARATPREVMQARGRKNLERLGNHFMSTLAAHHRWHVNRGQMNPKCGHCMKDARTPHDNR